jgi:adenine-specific DNA-methyltransferase
VHPSDYRVAEVRLFHDIATIGEASSVRAADNLLIRGDALNALTSLAQIPEFATQYLGQVKLAYLDPPFNTQQSFVHYDDALEHSVWLTMMRDRLAQIKPLLRADGSIWVHLDDAEMAYCKVMMDELFGRQNFVACIVWEAALGATTGTDIGDAHNFLLVYAQDRSAFRATVNKLPRDDTQLARFSNPDNDPRGPWRQGDDGTGKGTAGNRMPIELPSGRSVTPKEGRHWAFSRATFAEALAESRVYFGKNGDRNPLIKRYLSGVSEGATPRTWWPASEVGSNQEAKRDHLGKLFPNMEPFATPKPERLLHRIIHISTNPGDIVLDCFVGSGTTAAVAHKMQRRWVAIERETSTIDTYTLPRLRAVLEGNDPGGVTEITGWQSGGGFRVLDVAPSMFEASGGLVFLAEWMTNGLLAEATAAQLGFTYATDPPFSGRKGRIRLAVVDGVVNKSVVSLIVSALPERERVVICGTGVDTDARPLLRELRPGSTLRKIPAALLDEYRSTRQLRFGLAEPDGSEIRYDSAEQVGGQV